ncbi:uroporphyrinogen-III synthase [Roseibium sp. CAU 1637]|uniref:Uroporphyrinogen-III synthase n=1 Tax=Roseibium limicola TaxID=2816037 RepID=A0A939ET06_9HYPH|nr:uroporphyrinogen-III synthase [Roseibium limicola]MBO0346579.1 uroporphyrinogen-III synthase [Roseibium limicola]
MRFLVTRPEPQCSLSAQRLAGLGHEVLTVPLMQQLTVGLPLLPDAGYAAIAVTSARVAEVLAQDSQADVLKRLPVFAVGDRSATAMRQAGWSQVMSAKGAGADLAQLILQAGVKGRLLYPAAADRAFDLAAALQLAGITVDTQVVYRMEVLGYLPNTIEQALAERQLDGTLLYSRRSAEIFTTLVAAASGLELLRNQRVIVMSHGVASSLPEFVETVIATAPNEEALFKAALRLS